LLDDLGKMLDVAPGGDQLQLERDRMKAVLRLTDDGLVRDAGPPKQR
jgi:hypothetical protein